MDKPAIVSSAAFSAQEIFTQLWVYQLTVVSPVTKSELQPLLALFWVHFFAITTKFTFAVNIEPANVSIFISAVEKEN